MTSKPVVFSMVRKERNTDIPDLAIEPIFNNGSFINKFRKNAWKVYRSQTLPTGKEEVWRRTNLKDLRLDLLKQFDPEVEPISDFPDQLTVPMADEEHGGQVLISPFQQRISLDPDLVKQGVVFTDLKTAEKKHVNLLQKVLGKLIPAKTDKFTALAGALEANGVLLYVPKNVKVKSPLHSLYWAPGNGFIHGSHIIIFLDEGAEVTYVHESSSDTYEKGQSVHAGSFEVYVGPEAHLQFVELQSWGEHVWNFTHERVQVDRDATVDWIFGALGSHLTKNFSDLNLIGKGSTGKMSGFYFTDHNQHLDHDTQQNHLAPNTTSDLLFKGALMGKSRSVWQGMIYVAPVASKTDGYQANRNLVLSPNAHADSIPGLEILTDDVRCTHGATVGKIDKDQVFYLESRGMPRAIAERLIVEGFFDPIMQRIPFEGVKARFQAAIKQKMDELI